MAVKLTKNEQKKQKDQLKQFQRYLPTLILKKQQLQMVIMQIQNQIEDYRRQQKKVVEGMQDWIAVYGENSYFSEEHSIAELVKIERIRKGRGNIAGVAIPVFEELEFKDIPYSLYDYPLWVDQGLQTLKDVARFDAIISTLETQIKLLGKELRTTSQRVNLFEKVKIPEARENIKKIGIYLGDQQTAAVVRGKIAKKALQKGA